MDSSRIFVRGLPLKFTEDDVRKHFAKFPVTDVKFFPHRRIGYVGYKTSEDAAKAVKYFNKSFIKLTKIYAEIARPIADKELPKSRRQQKAEKSAPRTDEYIPPRQENDLKRKRDEVEQDPKLKEFLDVYQPPSKTNIWTNGDSQGGVDTGASAEETVQAVAVPEDESDNEYQVIAKKAKTASEPTKPLVDEEPMPKGDSTANIEQEAADTGEAMEDVQDVPTAEQGPVSDADWLRSRTNRVLELVEDDTESSARVPLAIGPISQPRAVEHASPQVTHEQAEPEQPAEAPVVVVVVDNDDAAPSDEEEDRIRETGRLYLRNLHFEVTEDELREQFSKHGALEEVHVPLKKIDGKGKGFAFVQFQDPTQAVEAYLDNDNTIFQGRLLHIISAKAKKDTKLDDFEISKLPLKKQKEIRRKQDAVKATFNWNSLYLNADAVMSTVANRMGISKAELLDPTSSDAAVKQAHAETHIIQETKSYFTQHGVDLEAFQRSAKGDLAILVKNVPHGVTPDELRNMFEEHGTVSKFLMPPTGMTAIVEFSNAAQAKTAFTSLSYRKMKDSILYLEKAPKDLFKEGLIAHVPQAASQDKPGAKLSATDLLEDAAEPEATNAATLYVRNLNFTTTTERLTEAFKPLSGFRSAKVKTKVDPKRGVLSMGFGFVEFNSPETASAALQTMDGHDLEGHKLQIKGSHKGADAAEERRKDDAAKKAASTKIIIKNLPFEASKKDVRALFTPYGQLRSVRVPKKFDSSSRGFGFAEFTTKRDAVNAMNALKNTHLLGRRLVLAFAETESDDPEKELEKMQQKVGAQANKVALQRLTAGGRKKFNVAGTDDLDE
ncbi:RNA-binding domain-containing protein [Cucurbitaria berberidis CBS 394.84]|uniref:Multiple RNA-binding domain-containing protein 1 n=1 Tax=Cucurbitaria berberidis CBS 394.84 TaxID=1168544 RepID=A0A9P4LEE7_9PLEO|nr:RNA-binding domain-containing protein [Cucurbitaria berberidis CBS 394.84]KAF1851302.1 RNA-binding domain-containing protein [Cucurbitaria berberidis CBS 394.84]